MFVGEREHQGAGAASRRGRSDGGRCRHCCPRRGDDRRRARGAAAADPQLIVHVGAGREQRAHRIDPPSLDANSSGVKPPSVRILNVRAHFDQRPHHFTVTLGRPPTSTPSGRASSLGRRSWRRAPTSSLTTSVFPRAGGDHQRGFAFGHGAVGVGSRLPAAPTTGRVGRFAGEQQRRHAVAIRDFDVGAGLDQQGDDARSLRLTAQCRAVVPSGSGALMLTRVGARRAPPSSRAP